MRVFKVQYRLRTLLILLAIVPPLLAGAVAWCARPYVTCLTVKSVAVSQLRLLSDAIALFALDVGELPRDLDALMVCPPAAAGWAGPYVEKSYFPTDPWNNAYQYELLDANAKRFRVWSKGPDGRSRTKDDLGKNVELMREYPPHVSRCDVCR